LLEYFFWVFVEILEFCVTEYIFIFSFHFYESLVGYETWLPVLDCTSVL
jgi:hypothetical protein